MRRVEDITEALWAKVSSPNDQRTEQEAAYEHIEQWRNRPLRGGKYPMCMWDGIYLKTELGDEYENVAILVAIAVNEDGYRGGSWGKEGMKEDMKAEGVFSTGSRNRGLKGIKPIVGDKCLGIPEASVKPSRNPGISACVVHFYRNVFSTVLRAKITGCADAQSNSCYRRIKEQPGKGGSGCRRTPETLKLKEASKKDLR